MILNRPDRVKPANKKQTIELVLSRCAHLFNAPLINPLSRSPMEILGVSGVEYLLGQLQMRKSQRGCDTLVLLLPAATFLPAEAESVTQALHRHAAMRIERESRAMQTTRSYGLRIFAVALALLMVLLALSTLFASDLTAFIPELLRRPLEYGFEIIGWVVMWHPIELLLFSPMASRARLNALHVLAQMKVVILADKAAAQE